MEIGYFHWVRIRFWAVYFWGEFLWIPFCSLIPFETDVDSFCSDSFGVHSQILRGINFIFGQIESIRAVIAITFRKILRGREMKREASIVYGTCVDWSMFLLLPLARWLKEKERRSVLLRKNNWIHRHPKRSFHAGWPKFTGTFIV